MFPLYSSKLRRIENFRTVRRYFMNQVRDERSLNERHLDRHCPSCTCPATMKAEPTLDRVVPELPPPLPEPKVSFLRRVLPQSLVPLDSKEGRRKLLQSLSEQTAAPYIALTEQFANQSDPAFCGITTLLMVLNSFAMDPYVRWRGGWRFYGDESFLLAQCCMEEEKIRRIGIHMDDFLRLARCQGLRVEMKRPDASRGVEEFRKDIEASMEGEDLRNILVVSFSRASLGQTGDGHFSPIAALHEDQVLILDVARFKYQPYWVKVEDLYSALRPIDEATGESRGWFIMKPPEISSTYTGVQIHDEKKIDADRISTKHSGCPLHEVKINYCKSPLKSK